MRIIYIIHKYVHIYVLSMSLCILPFLGLSRPHVHDVSVSRIRVHAS